MLEVISRVAIDRRFSWIAEIGATSDDFGSDSLRIEETLVEEIKRDGSVALLDHLRLCSAIPESCGHDSREEKLYSKYTDILVSASYSHMGLESVVLAERSDSADVEVVAGDYGFVADAKVFRLSRTAKNQKDFKIHAVDSWKRGKEFAMIVCPLYQFPSRSSQIYLQAAVRNVCLFSYSHLTVLVRLAESEGERAAAFLLREIFKTVQAMNPSKNANSYWQAVNRAMLQYGEPVASLWRTEKMATVESISISKDIALAHYANQRESIMRLDRKIAIEQLIKMHKVDNRIEAIRSVSDNRIMEIS